MEHLKMQSLNMIEENVKKIGDLFPNCITETKDKNGEVIHKIDFDILKQELSNTIVEGKEERYQFTWPEKRNAILTANTPINKTLRPYPEESLNFDTTKNLYIEGDNLDSLKLLRETYLGKIKMIYIDPPYNTGSDFIYNDNFDLSQQEFEKSSGLYDEDGNQTFVMDQNTESNGRFHTDWLNMMYPRLKIAKDLLSSDGSIFVSIDYNEFANMKKLLDEIFGAENFQREIIWRIGWLSGYKTMAPNFIRNHDTILFYSKDRTQFSFNKEYLFNKDFKPLVKKEPKLNQKLTELGLNKKQQDDLLNFINHENRTDKYPLEDTWNCNEYDDLNSIAIVSFSGEKISKILEINQDFKGQKSVKMLQRIIRSVTSNDDIILDFFSGTASTAHAVLQQNIEDGGNRKFIMMQLPELTYEGEIDTSSSEKKYLIDTNTGYPIVKVDSEARKNGYYTICEIAKERLRRVFNRMKNETNSEAYDFGFRVLKCDSSNMEDVFYSPENITEQDLFKNNIKPNRTSEDLLFQVMLDLGIPLSSKIQTKAINKKHIFYVGDNYLIACFDDDIDEKTIEQIAKEKPYYFVMKDSSMANDNVATNFEQIFKTYLGDNYNSDNIRII